MAVRVSEASASTVDVVVIGGGAAGLAAASSLAHRDILVLEREDRLGGRLHSLERGEDWINLGAHLLTGGDSAIKALAERYRLPLRTIPGVKTALWFKGTLYTGRHVESYPLTLPLSLRARLDLVRIGMRVRLLAAEWNRAGRRRGGEDDLARDARLRRLRAVRTFGDLLARATPEVAEIFRTAVRRSSADADQITVGGAAALFGALWVSGRSSSVLNIEGGSGRLGTELEKRLRDRAVLGAEVTEVAEREGRVDVSYSVAGSEHRTCARYAIVATPAFEAARIVSTMSQGVADELSSIVYGTFVCLGVLTAELPDLPWDDVYAITAPGMSFDMLFNHSNPFRASGTDPSRRSLMCYVGGRRAEQLLELTDAEIERTLLTDLVEVLPEVADAIEETAVTRWRAGNSVPAPSTHLSDAQEWNNRSDGRLFLAGDYFAPLGGTIEAATVSGLRCAELVGLRSASRPSATQRPAADREPATTAEPATNPRTD